MKKPNLLFNESRGKVIPKVPPALIFWKKNMRGQPDGRKGVNSCGGDATGEGR